MQSTCGWALVSVGWPWVAQRVWPMAAWTPDLGASEVRSASWATGEGVVDPGDRLGPRLAGPIDGPAGDQRHTGRVVAAILELVQPAQQDLAAVGAVTAWRHPRENGHQGGIVGAGQVLRVTQCPETARRAARADDYPAYAGHGSAPSSRPVVTV